MKNIVLAVIALLSAVGGLMACPTVVHNRSVVASTPYVSPVVVSEVYPSTQTVATEVHVTVTQALYSAFLAPAVVVPYVPPPLPPPVVVPQIPLVPAAVPAAPVCPPAAMPAPVAPAVSEDFCAKVLARLDRIDARQASFEARLRGDLPPPVVPPMPNDRPQAVAPKALNLATTCASCHGAVTPYHDAAGKLAPTFFDAAGVPKMTDTQIRKAIRQIKAQKMPPVDSAAAKAATPDILNACLDELDDLAAVETKPTP